MLTIRSGTAGGACDGIPRRDFLRLGTLALGGFSLPWLLEREARAADEGTVKDKSVIFLFLCGGPSHIETFDPNMEAPAPHCSLTGEVKTALTGVTFGATFPKLAALAKRLAVVRSYSPHEIADHALAIRHVFTAGGALGPRGGSLGAIATRLFGRSLTSGGLPTHAQIIEGELDPQYREDEQRMRASNAAGALGSACVPFDPTDGGPLAEDLTLNLPLERMEDRLSLHRALDGISRRVDASGQMEAVDRFHQQAMSVILGGATRRALDLGQEDPRLVARYDTSHLEAGWLKRRPSTLGRRLLMARRLVEAGSRFVTVGMAGWDNHGNENHPGVVDGMHHLGRQLDHAVSALLEDLERRGLSKKVLLVMTGEFGRTPRIEKKGGRDHWPGLCPLVFAGGGLRMGQVIGRSERTAHYPASDPVRLENLVSTLMHALFDVGRLRLDPRVSGELLALAEKPPIRELF